MIPAAGQRVGPYEILGRLGRGGMGLVFSAWDSRLHRDVAIKLLREEFVRGDSHERFLTEARAASGLNHPNICTIFDIGEQDGDPYLVMELLKGETLRQRISSGQMSPEEILPVACEIADALAAAHARGIIHRDVKPANIFLVARPTGGWQAKVLDFGLAKIDMPDGLDPRYQMTGAGSAIGTVAYMSPEQARGEALDARSDLFALGIVLYEMATGHVPFEGVTSALIFVQLLSKPPEPIREFEPGFPKELERIILKLLAKERGERFQSAVELTKALQAIDLKKSAPRVSLFSKPGLPWARNSERDDSAVRETRDLTTARPAQEVKEAGISSSRSSRVTPAGPGKAEVSSSDSKPSEVVTIRPVRMKPLPPTEFPASTAHWTRPPRLSGVGAAAESSGSVRAALSPAETESLSTPSRAPALAAPGAVKRPSSAPRSPAAAAGVVENEGRVSVIVDGVLVANPVPPPVAKEQGGTFSGRKWIWLPASIVVGALILTAVFYAKSPRPAPARTNEVLMLGAITNRSGDKRLDGVVMEGLRMALGQSPHLFVPDATSTVAVVRGPLQTGFDAAVPVDARRAAVTAHATSYLSGDIRNEAGHITISLQVYSASTGASLVQAEETASSREQISDAIDRLSAQIRIGLGEASDGIGRTSVPLARDATSNIEAFEDYAAGVNARAVGRSLDAMTSLQHAVQVEPRFTQAWLQLAEIYQGEHAEVAAADAASHAKDASVGSSDRTKLLAEASYQMNATGDLPRALALLDQIAGSYPLDTSLNAMRAYLFRAQGQFPEALEAAQQALESNPFDYEAAAEGEAALLALDRGDAAMRMEAQAEQRGQRHAGLRLLISTMSGGAPAAGETDVDRQNALAYRAEVLDATGQISAGLATWKSAAALAGSNPALASAAAFDLAQAGLNRALMSDCAGAAALTAQAAALPRGQQALFAVGMAQGLCGDLTGSRNAVLALMAQYPQSFAVKNYYLANLTAVDQIRSGDNDAALTTLQTAKQYDLLSMAPYLRGMAHSGAKQWTLAIADFQFALLHRGSTTLGAAPVYAMSQLGLARAYEASGDRGNAATAYGAFLGMWKAADGSNALAAEARKYAQ